MTSDQTETHFLPISREMWLWTLDEWTRGYHAAIARIREGEIGSPIVEPTNENPFMLKGWRVAARLHAVTLDRIKPPG